MSEGHLRAVEPEDIDLLYEWANDKETRKNAFSSEYISFETHKLWFANILKSDKVFQFIYYYNNKSVGQIRLDIENDNAYIDYSINHAHRGQGHGKSMLLLTEELVRNQYPNIKNMIAQVKEENKASQKVIESLNYKKVFIEYSKEITKDR